VLLDVFLDVKRAVVERAQGDLVLKQGLGRVAIVDSSQEPPPGADGRLEHDRIANLLDGLDRGFRSEGDYRSRRRDTGLDQRHRR
jgi:hypothetical protein